MQGNLFKYVIHTYISVNFTYRMGRVTMQNLTPNRCYVQSCCNINDMRLCYVPKSTGAEKYRHSNFTEQWTSRMSR